MSGEFPPSAALFLRKLGQAIARKREVEGLSVAELAAAIGLTAGEVEQIELGKYPLKHFMLGSIGCALNVEPGDLVVLATIERLSSSSG